jgi:hypothetical protein
VKNKVEKWVLGWEDMNCSRLWKGGRVDPKLSALETGRNWVAVSVNKKQSAPSTMR